MTRSHAWKHYLAGMALGLLTLALMQCCWPVPAPAMRPDVMAPPSPLTPAEIVAELEQRYNLPGALDRAWARECSRQQIGDSKYCRNHAVTGFSVGERGAFQMTRSAAEHSSVRCSHRRLGVGDFAYEAECAAKYLLYWTIRCGDQQRGEIAYVRGFCATASRAAGGSRERTPRMAGR